MKIQNIQLKNQSLSYKGKLYSFDSEGVAEIEEEKATELLRLKTYLPLEEETNTKQKETLEKEQETSHETEVSIEDLKVSELKELLNEKGIPFDKNLKRNELIDLLK